MVRYIFQEKLCYYLLEQGFCQIDMNPHDKQSNRMVYTFIDSKQLRAAIEKYNKN